MYYGPITGKNPSTYMNLDKNNIKTVIYKFLHNISGLIKAHYALPWESLASLYHENPGSFGTDSNVLLIELQLSDLL